MQAHSHDHDNEHGHDAHEQDWQDEGYVASWLERQAGRAAERQRQFVRFRALIPKRPDDEFSYLNLGCGPGNLDQVLLEHFSGAQATLVDYSMPMLDAAQEQLARHGDRVEYVQADLSGPEWTGAVSGPFDLVVASLSVHHLEDPRRVRQLYRECYRLIGHGGMFLSLDYVRPVRRTLGGLEGWASRDPDAGFAARHHHGDNPGTLAEHLLWLSEAGFACADALWKELDTVLLCGIHDHVHLPEDGDHEHGHEGGGH